MYPCVVCGGGTLTASGHCAGCGAPRGDQPGGAGQPGGGYPPPPQWHPAPHAGVPPRPFVVPPPPTGPVAGDVDPCLVGRWRVTSHRETVGLNGVGNVTFTGGAGV